MCTLEKRGSLFVLSLTGDDQHRLNSTLIASLLSTFSQIRSQASPGSVLITTAHGRFFSNGFDLAWAQSAGSPSAARDRLLHMVASFKPVVAALFSLPMPTIAALPGHAAGAGLMLAMSHDYILMRSDKGVLYMPEVDLGMTLPDYFVVGLRSKIRSSAGLRDILLRGLKVKATEGVKMGIVSSAHDSTESVMEASVRLGEELAQRKWNGEVYAELRKSLYPEMCEVLGLTHRPIVSKI
ncbi:enoyl-CoA delta isomerase 2, peroxisomal-like [Neltuma alba]|uniref:enoyl-CoA delta isomerase 2, peroxisomal-like n=1 Tax=Neltuma alba TaxID=207710 RepID=UPI0010A40E43|nr:enoyl-CoA delta isomerase 2, peroxisomal-like [Prosopis alba]